MNKPIHGQQSARVAGVGVKTDASRKGAFVFGWTAFATMRANGEEGGEGIGIPLADGHGHRVGTG